MFNQPLLGIRFFPARKFIHLATLYGLVLIFAKKTLRSLPKGGRLVPGLLDHVLPSNLPATEEATEKGWKGREGKVHWLSEMIPWKSSFSQTKWLVFRMIHGARIPDPTFRGSSFGRRLDFLGIRGHGHFLGGGVNNT